MNITLAEKRLMARHAVQAMNNEIIDRLIRNSMSDAELEQACALLVELIQFGESE